MPSPKPHLPLAEPDLIPTDARRLRILNTATKFDQKLMSARSFWRRRLLKVPRQFLPYYFVSPPLWRVLLRDLVNGDRAVPNFGSLGAVRSGTTQLSDYIMQHPCVVLPLAKEIGVKGHPLHKLIMAQFPTKRQMLATQRKYGVAMTGYCSPDLTGLRWPFFARNMAPDAKIVIILRDPVDRTFAQWRWDQVLLRPVLQDPLWQGFPNFDEIVRMEVDGFKDGGHAVFGVSGGRQYIRNSIYLPFLKMLRRFYREDQILYVKSEDFFADPAGIAKGVYEFLGLPPYEPVVLPVRNSAPPRELDPGTRRFLSEFYAPFNRALYDFLGRDFGWQ